MVNIPHLLDTVIKAPLWFFLAGTIAFGVPLLNLEVFKQAGITSDLRLGGLPIAFYALISFSLFASSAVARSYSTVRKYIFDTIQGWLWWRRLSNLPEEARAILAVLEHEGSENFHYEPEDNSISILRDRDLVFVKLMSGTRSWGRFSLSYLYRDVYHRHRSRFRSALRCSSESMEVARKTMRAVERRTSSHIY